jgi:hypothetical protein
VLSSLPSSATEWLCDLEQVTQCLCISVPSFVQRVVSNPKRMPWAECVAHVMECGKGRQGGREERRKDGRKEGQLKMFKRSVIGSNAPGGSLRLLAPGSPPLPLPPHPQ